MKNSIIHFVKVVPPQLLYPYSGGATIHPVPIAFSPMIARTAIKILHVAVFCIIKLCRVLLGTGFFNLEELTTFYIYFHDKQLSSFNSRKSCHQLVLKDAELCSQEQSWRGGFTHLDILILLTSSL